MDFDCFVWIDVLSCYVFFFFKQKTAYEMRISDWSSDVCSSDLAGVLPKGRQQQQRRTDHKGGQRDIEFDRAKGAEKLGQREQHIGEGRNEQRAAVDQIGRASCRERVCQYV